LTHFDRRLHAIRDDLADARLRNDVDAARYAQGRRAFVRAPVVDLKRKPTAGAGLDTQLIYGASVMLFDESEGWAWVQCEHDGYVGYVDAEALAEAQEKPTHRVAVPRSFVYPGADLRFPRRAVLSMGSAITIVGETETRGTRYALTADGDALIAAHLRPVGEAVPDYVAVAELFLNTPYLWGGTTGFGIDCSGLVQTSMMIAGKAVLRDTDMQEERIGVEIDPSEGLQRGDLVFWKGHVAIMTDARTMIHANGHTMMVSLEPLADATQRIGYLYGEPTRYRRP
jgi:cell wall-associated NlpC family hydrolase